MTGMGRGEITVSILQGGYRSNRRLRVTPAVVLIGAATLTACAVRMPAGYPGGDRMPEMPTDEQIEEMTQAQMGKPKLQEEVQTGGIRVVFQTGHASTIDAVALSDDGRYIVTTAGDEAAKLWDIASGQEVRTIRGLDFGFGRRVSFVGETHRVVIGGGMGTPLRVIDSETGRELSSVGGIGLGGLAQSAAVSAHGRFAAFVPTDEQGRRAARIPDTIAVVDLATGRSVATLKTGQSTSPAAISDDGKTLIVQRTDTEKMSTRAALKAAAAGQAVMPEYFVEIWDVRTQKRGRVTQFLPDGSAGPASGTLSYDGRWTALEQIDQSIEVTDTQTGELVQKLAAPVRPQWSGKPLVFSKDGRLLAAVRQDRIDIWAMPEGKLVKQIEGSAVNFSADGKTVVAGKAQGGAPFLHELATGRVTALGGGATAIGELEVIGDGRAVVAAAQTGGAKLWDLATGQLTRTFECEGGAGVHSLSASPAGPYLATGCHDGAVYLWNTSTGKRLRTFVAPKKDEYGWMAVVRFDPTGQRLAIGAREDLSVFETASGRELRRITLPRGKLPMDVFDPSNMPNLSEEQRAEMARYASDPNAISMQHAIHAMEFHPDGIRIAVARQYSLSVWDLGSGQLVREFSAKAARALEPPPTEQDAFMRKLMSGEPLTREDMKKLEKSQKDGTYGAMVMSGRADMGEMIEQSDRSGALDGARDLAFSPDGRTLLSLDFQDLKLWEVDTGRRIRRQRLASENPLDAMGGLDISALMRQAQTAQEPNSAQRSGIAVSPDGRFAARGYGRTIKVRDLATGEDIAQFVGHTSDITSVAFARGGRVIVSGANDGSVRLWTAPQGKEIAQFIALGASDFVTVTPDQYYRISRRGIGGVAFRVNDRLYPFEQFDLRFNRPDIILERLGQTSPQVVKSYRAAYDRRLKKLGFTEAMLGSSFNLPEVSILTTNVPITTADATLALRVRSTDAQQPLDRINVFVNDVPVFGTAGMAVADRSSRTAEQSVQVPLVPGRNKIQVSVLNQQGAESLKQTVYTTSTAEPPPRDIYVVAIGVSEYRESAYNLRFAAKDAQDLMDAYREGARGFAQGEVHVLDLTNAKATRTGIRQAREWLKQSRVNDLVVVFAAGHGMTDANQNYFFGTHDIDPERPELAGLPYEDFEALVDGIPSLQKVLLIDTCFSGEIEKDEATVVAQVDTQGAGTVSMRAFKAARGVTVVADDGESGNAAQSVSPDIVRVQQELFADLRRGTGAVVISSASGNEYALEGDQWRNGVFTYALLDGLKNGRADANGDQNITIGELQAHVIEAVRTLTQGGQNPTVRRENLDYDFTVY